MKKEKIHLLIRSITRRSLLDYSSKTALALTGSFALPLSLTSQARVPVAAKSDSPITVGHSACLVNCGSRCALKVYAQDGRIISIKPEPAKNDKIFGLHQIRPCLRGRSNRWRVYSPDRIKYPMLRIGKREEGKFKRISWEKATKLIADRLRYTIDSYGNDYSIY